MNQYLPQPPIQAEPTASVWTSWFLNLWTTFTGQMSLYQKASDPTTADIANNTWAVYKNTTSGLVKMWANDNGTMKSVTLT